MDCRSHAHRGDVKEKPTQTVHLVVLLFTPPLLTLSFSLRWQPPTKSQNSEKTRSAKMSGWNDPYNQSGYRQGGYQQSGPPPPQTPVHHAQPSSNPASHASNPAISTVSGAESIMGMYPLASITPVTHGTNDPLLGVYVNAGRAEASIPVPRVFSSRSTFSGARSSSTVLCSIVHAQWSDGYATSTSQQWKLRGATASLH